MKLNLLLIALAGAVAAMPAPDNSAAAPAVEDADAAAAAAAEADDISILATRKWTAEGGCKQDWAGRCNAQCRGEASQKGYRCRSLDSNIVSDGCVWTWNACKCTCFT